MLKRLLSSSLLLVLTVASAHAALRAPQVPVSGTALATFFASQGQTIDVSASQLELQALGTDQTGFEVDTFDLSASQATFGAYNAGAVTPSLYPIAYAGGLPGFFEIAAFRSAPARLIVNVVDESSVYSTTTFVGADGSNFGFYLQPIAAPALFTQDSRNPDGPRILAFAGTGARAGRTWLACETGASS